MVGFYPRFLLGSSDTHPPSVFTAMQTIIAAILEESEKIPLSLLDILLNNLLKHKKAGLVSLLLSFFVFLMAE